MITEGIQKIFFIQSFVSPNNLEELVNDLITAPNVDEVSASRRTSRLSTSTGTGTNVDEVKSVKFASSSSSSRNKTSTTTGAGATSGQAEEMNTISTIRTLLQ